MTARPLLPDLLNYASLDDRGHTSDTRSWRLVLNRCQECDFDHLLLVLDDPSNPRKPTLALEAGGMNDGRYPYDGLRFVELGGGGVALVPYLIVADELWIATTRQSRLFLGEAQPGLIRGYKPPKVAADQHVLEEAVQEFGRSILAGGQPFPLLGLPVNSASHIIDTRPLPNEPNPGGYMFGVPLAPDCIDLTSDGPVLKDSIFEPSDKLESLFKGRILPWWEAVRCRDGVLPTGVARLMSTLRERGQMGTSFNY